MSNLLFLLILLPAVAAAVCYFVRSSAVRTLTVLATGAVLTAASLALLGQGIFDPLTVGSVLGIPSDFLVTVLDFALLGVIFMYGVKHRNLLIQGFTLAQAALLVWFELVMVKHAAVPALAGDQLSLIMVLVISIVGSLICIFAIPYMKEHEEHLHLKKSRQPQFFFFLLLFLGAMNGLVLSNNILWLYFFFEVTTLCSFMLIGHDATEVAVKNSVRALWMNSLGGLAFVLGMMLVYSKVGTLDISAILAGGPQGALMVTGVGFLCLAGFTKAAQVPFQSWLLGAMVAPTPVSALLHSSTMVKAGVYVVLRFAPAYSGTLLSDGVAVCGAFTFLACAALCIGQSNGKKILAYSTVSNLGLIICCAGLNTPLAITAAVLLIIFHAISKSLLFLCVGAIEQAIGSRDIEDMRGLYAKFPRTATITIIGILTMLLPPFGVLMSKWMAMEAASANIYVIVMLAMGSALTMVYWARWGGLLMATREAGAAPEKQAGLIRMPLTVLCLGAVFLSLASPWIYNSMLAPMFDAPPFTVSFGSLDAATGSFAVVPLFIVLGLGALYAVKAASGFRKVKIVAPYLSGSNTGDEGTYIGPMNSPVPFSAGNMYLGELFAEGKLTPIFNALAVALIVLMLGGAL
ncbi:MAG: NADH-quinone oxidoreductase subunit L [Pseudodesulfovibrio sp.]|uniref:NADH/Ubiquinone/plastoquinone (Complex I) n=1 Tax=Pseudodesulfovibrio aespoeensis (strain ATCC 700646 / DSM 10631 / Aspo-2) TaxID=643562 RepID=E6VU73_PSEA9|nr:MULTISPECIES: proton-conducting transporter membrane subunit [Pseudodesulfovibrio]MBU4191641.1 NADH-quinone oxidoreductase subunit L [Pseudomonadota bacterium]ADU63380.1 NADH/Ubiquinone/plastoquinone (complex I) [Pseudodesulfovibrio aespoeensis Aspo-2]MBU4245186.1 NADH-quinone oxidoreductase subunit L [Pseudomonadota bacterium]MBU4379878.1 NADH-quinone oxidoreductase subunit L [Pseudomonadota bacterium]MBU4476506.1 NADH-quinone oxidoreductase subunit L [Pseudomonadota bacterium]